MEYRRLGTSGLKVPALSFGTATFGGNNEIFRAFGDTDVAGARRLIDICVDAGVTMFDTANSYSYGLSEEILGQALKDKRDQVLLCSKVTTPMSDEPNEGGSSRYHLLRAVEDSLTRLRTDHLDVLYLHEFDATTAVEEVLRTLNDLVSAGKVRYVGASNFSAWALMKSIAIADRYGWERYAAHQVQYSLAVRDYEHELAPLAADQGVGGVIWSPLGGGALTGKVRRGQALPADSRISAEALGGLPFEAERIHRIVDALEQLVNQTGHTISQIALNWLLQQPTVSSIVLGARHEAQLTENLGEASATPLPYPYDHQQHYEHFQPRNWMTVRR
jgi:aryl-alcohol dehydrogenase-like predicted oxidoreductase